jgi:thymidylate kinase
MGRVFVVLSGLPGSGKTTLARPLSAELGLPLLDKDDILESLFESLGVSTPEERRRLSGASDRVLLDLARTSQGAVLSSFWRRESLSKTAGTPTEWLRELPDASVVEVLCECPPRLAAARYEGRQRHPGHFDDHKTAAELEWQFEQLEAAGPLSIGPLLRVDTTRQVDVEALARAVRESAG